MLRQFLHPGTLFVSKGLTTVSTILGSCVAVCLWDGVRRIGGINHYLLPFWNGDGLATPRYGNVAINRLLERMEMQGAHRPEIVAKVFGGAKINREAGGLFLVGERNIQVAWELLRELEIPVAGYDVGGVRGRKVVFDTSTGIVQVTKSLDWKG